MRRWLLPLLFIVELALFLGLEAAHVGATGSLPAHLARYVADLIAQSAPLLLLALGMTFVIATAGIDLSVASMTALVACVMASFAGELQFWWTAVPVGLIAGGALGFCNGALIAWLDIPPIIATLGTMITFRGLCFTIMRDAEKAPFVSVPGYEIFGQFSGAAVLVVVLFAAGAWMLIRARWSRELLMLGGNRVAARYAGIAVTRRTLEVYTLMGLLAVLAAVCFTARNGSVSASSLTGLELQVIVAVVLGGTRVQGGTASVVGTLIAALAVAILDEGLRSAAIWGDRYVPFKLSHLRFVLLGLLLVLGVWLNTREARPARGASPA